MHVTDLADAHVRAIEALLEGLVLGFVLLWLALRRGAFLSVIPVPAGIPSPPQGPWQKAR